MIAPIKLKISLKELPHKCERTLLVPENINLRQLHFLIQDAFGWFNAHLFEFTDAKLKQTIRIGMPDDSGMDDWSDLELIHAHDVQLKDTFMEAYGGGNFWYNYDFGDDWWHQITFLKITKKDTEDFKGIPICTKAVGKCPPENVGGIPGYRNFLKIIKNKKHPEHEEIAAWCGLEMDEEYDETLLNLAELNLALEEFYDSEFWEETSYDFF